MLLQEFANATGASAKQISLWSKVLPLALPREPGAADRPRNYDETLIPRVRVLAAWANKCGQDRFMETLKALFENYDEGVLILDEDLDVTLEW